MPSRPRELWLFATLWSLRQYPTAAAEWSWARKFAAIRRAGFDGVFAPPLPVLADRGRLRYLAVTSLGVGDSGEEAFRSARALGAVAMDVQLGDYDTPPAAAGALARRIAATARRHRLPFAIETHRDTFTETPEATLALARGYRRRTGKTLPLCLDHSHFAVVRHLPPGQLWPRLKEPAELLRAARQFHLRPFNGHHCQLPALTPKGGRTPEYRDWLAYAEGLLAHERARRTAAPLLVVVELGHAAPAYGLSCFPDTWRDAVAVARDLRRIWRRLS
ncbi:MAG: xylose isomerase [Verrucomicrobia bacterium]|nr:xylose isomerase [Verrucomicrobiota bacterium]